MRLRRLPSGGTSYSRLAQLLVEIRVSVLDEEA